MKLYSLTLPVDNGFEALSELGALECLQFSDFEASSQVMNRIFFSEAQMVQELLSDLSQICSKLTPYSEHEISPYIGEDSSSVLLSETRQFLKGKTLGEFLHEVKYEIEKDKTSIERKISALQSIEQKAEIGIEKFLLMAGLKKELKEGFGLYSEPNSQMGNDIFESNFQNISGIVTIQIIVEIRAINS